MNSDFNPVEYFTSLNYDHKFIQMVMNSLEGNSIGMANSGSFAASYGYRKTPTKVERE
jgi:hypothetical protein